MSVYECYVDGASRGQGAAPGQKTGQGACAVLIFKNKKLVGQYARGLGAVTNNHAEYEAVIHALLMCWAADIKDPIIYSDSAVVVNHITGKWKCNAPALQPLLLSVREIQEDFNFRIVHVPRRDVKEADRLANLLLDKLSKIQEDASG